MSYTLGIDIGTFESKGVLVDGDGEIVASAARQHEMLVPREGWAEHRAEEDWWGDLVAITREILESSRIDPGEIAAMGCSAIGPCMLPVDRQGNPLMNGVLYGVDTRSEKEIEEITQRYGEDSLIAGCGNALTSQSVGPKIMWLKRNHGDLYDKTAVFHTATSFLVRRLTGVDRLDHYTAANFSPLYTLDSGGWAPDFAEGIIESERLPGIGWTTDIAGTVTAAASRATGLKEGTPVITGTIDAAAEAVSVGVRGDGEMMMMYGSTIFIIMPTGDRVTDRRLWYAPWLFEGQHASMAGLATSGTLTQWFRERFAPDIDRQTVFGLLTEEAAASPPGANGLILLPYFSGERTPIHDPHAKGVLFGLNLTHSRGDIYRALLEGIALSTGHVIETYREIGHAPERLYAVGGGTQNRVWTQATSDITGLPQIVRSKTIGACYGDAFLAALAIGAVSRDDIDAWNPVERVIEPDPTNAEVYRNRYRTFRDLYEQTRDLMARPV